MQWMQEKTKFTFKQFLRGISKGVPCNAPEGDLFLHSRRLTTENSASPEHDNEFGVKHMQTTAKCELSGPSAPSNNAIWGPGDRC